MIDRAYKTKDVDVAGFKMLSFVESFGDHRNFVIEITTRSMIGEFAKKMSALSVVGLLWRNGIACYDTIASLRSSSQLTGLLSEWTQSRV